MTRYGALLHRGDPRDCHDQAMSHDRWSIDSEHGYRLVGPYEDGHRFTLAEFATQDWPPCPVCGRIVNVTPVDVTSIADTEPFVITGRWGCPNGCDPKH